MFPQNDVSQHFKQSVIDLRGMQNAMHQELSPQNCCCHWQRRRIVHFREEGKQAKGGCKQPVRDLCFLGRLLRSLSNRSDYSAFFPPGGFRYEDMVGGHGQRVLSHPVACRCSKIRGSNTRELPFEGTAKPVAS